MDENIYIGLFCLNHEEAKNFYIRNLEFKDKCDEKIYSKKEKNIRTILIHALVKNLEVEFMTPKNIEETNRIGASGGSINLFTIPTQNIDEIKNNLKNTKFFIDYVDTPYASFLTLKDPMGNKICIYEKA